MTCLFLGSGLDSMTPSDTAVTENSSGQQDTSFTRSATYSPGGVSYAEGPGWSAVQDIWVHGYFYAPTINQTLFQLFNSGTANFRLTTTSGTALRMEYLSGASTWTQLGSDVPVAYNTPQYIDVHFKTGASGEAALYLGGTERTTASGSYTYSADIDNFRLIGGLAGISGLAIADEPTIGWRVMQGYMSGAGADTAWTGDYSSVDEAALSDADFINSGTANQVETFTFTLPQSLTGYVPRAVCVSARARRGAGGPQNLQLALRSSGTTYFSGSKALGLGYEAYQHIWETNPATSADWLSSQIATLQPGVKSIT